MVIRDKTYTADEFYALMAERDDDLRFELVEGYIVEMAPPRSINSRIALKIGSYLNIFAEEHDLGYVFGADVGYILSPGDVRIPDASFVAKARVQGNFPDLITGAPDLAVEVIIPSETTASINEKTRLYLNSGAYVVWIIYPDDRFAEIRTASKTGFHVETIDIDGALTASAVLPDFELPLSKIFPKSTSSPEA